MVIDIEPYYGLSPVWLRVIQRPIETAAKTRYLNETVMYEMYKKHFGRKKATYYKVYFDNLILLFLNYIRFIIQNPEHGLRVSAQRGLACIFQALARKTPLSGLSKPNLRDGLTLMHYAV